MNQTQIRYLLAFGWGVYAGVVGGYFAGKHKYQKLADEEIESVKEVYSRTYKTGDYETPAKAATKFKVDEIIRTARYNLMPVEEDTFVGHHLGRADVDQAMSIQEAEDIDVPKVDVIDPEDLEPNVSFDVDDKSTGPRTTLYDTTLVTDPDVPYVISIDEFMSDEGDYDKITLVYYDGDDTLADEQNHVVRNIRDCVGEEFLTQFGARSGDKNIVHVRNERLGTDYEIALEPRSFKEVVFGFTDKKTSRGMRFKEDD